MNNEQYRKDFLTNLIALNSFAEVLAEQENPELTIINKLKERTLLMYQTLVAIEFDAKISVPQAQIIIPTAHYAPQQPIVPMPITMETIMPNTTTTLHYSTTDLHEFNTEIHELFTAPETLAVVAPLVATQLPNTPEFITPTPTSQTITAQPQFTTPPPQAAATTIPARTPLKNFLGFNDKIQIQQNLFGGNNDALTNFMTVIDNCETSQRAIGLINEYKNNLQWDKESEAFHNLIAIIEQKFR